MKLYTCCPKETCNSFQKALNWLKSFGIEPALEFDGEFHFFEFDFPDEWGINQRIEFKWQLAHRATGLVFCRCERWLDEAAEGQVGKLVCRSCGTEYMFCSYCDAYSQWAGCDCDKDESSSCDTHPADE